MLHKIERLTSIGKFRDYQASGDVAFKKLTLFYGDNGGGKTTLTTILRSLTSNKPELILRRISTNSTTAQAAQIIQRNTGGDTHHTFNATSGWRAAYPDIEIFDTHFVNDNIYSGFDFSDEHKKQLHQFVIGSIGVAIQQQLEQNKTTKTASRQIQSDIEQQLIDQVGNNLTSDMITAFLTINATQATNIAQQITTAETALTNANANSVIQTLQSLSTLPGINSGINFPALITDLQTTTQAIQDAVLEALFTSHCQDLSNNTLTGPESWLKRGFTYLEHKKTHAPDGQSSTLSCPFCQQEIEESLPIINAYTSKFNEIFNSLVQRLQVHLTALQAFNLETVIQGLNNLNTSNGDRVTTWSTHLPTTVTPPTFNIFTNIDDLRTEFQNLISTVQQKIQNPSIAVSDTPASTFEASLQSVSGNIASYNQTVTAYNQGITTFRGTIQTVVQAQLELDRLNRIIMRFEPAVDTLCTQLTAERQTLRGLETAYTQLNQQQQAAATTFFNSYKDRINHYLGTVFKTPFRIDDVAHVAPQGRATQSKVNYKLTIDGADISFDPNQPNSAKDCLSEGDKSTIALAFFLSKLDIDTGLANKILVFDDPLSSFDSNRRMYTIQIIKDLFPNIKQVIVLSHNEYFLYELSKGFAAGDKKTLRISPNFVTNASIIEPLDLDSMVQNDYFKHIKELESFLETPDLGKKDTVLGWLRNVLESHIRFKFYRQLSGLPGNSQTFGTLITTLVNQNVVFRDNANRTTIISKLNLINGVSSKPHHGEAVPDYTALGVNPNTMNVTELAGLITDTLNLVDNEL